MEVLRAIDNSSGGIGYHFRAFRYRNNLWQDFRENLNLWLEQSIPAASTLIIVGPSAGYCFKPEFFERFERIIGVEIDPIARALFCRRHRRNVHWIRNNIFVDRHLLTTTGLERIHDQYPNSALLLANFLGQFSYAFSMWENQLTDFRQQISQFLHERKGASFHDRLSTCQLSYDPKILPLKAREIDNQKLAAHFWLPQQGKKLCVVEHATTDLFSRAEKTWMHWTITPAQGHIIECVNLG